MDYKITLEIYFGTQKNLVTVFIKCKGMAIYSLSGVWWSSCSLHTARSVMLERMHSSRAE